MYFPQVFYKKNKPDDYQYPEYQPKNSHSVAHTITVTVHHSELHIYPPLIAFDFCSIKGYSRGYLLNLGYIFGGMKNIFKTMK
jgi:hypothetical protein